MGFGIRIQEIVFEFFKEVKDETFLEIVDYVAFDSTDKLSPCADALINRFIDENGMQSAFDNHKHDLTEPAFFRRSSGSEMDIISKIKTAFLVSCRNRLYKSVNADKTKADRNKSKFNFLKKTALGCYECLNRSEQYFDGEIEDGKIVEKINTTFYEN